MATPVAQVRWTWAGKSRWRIRPALLLAPALLFVLGPVVYPLGLEAWLSLTDAGTGDPGHFIGLANFASLARSSQFGQTSLNTIVYAGGGALLKAAVGSATAFALAKTFRGRRLVYALLVLPFAFPVGIGAVAWYFLLSAGGEGAIDYALRQAHLITQPLGWLSRGPLPMTSVLGISVWHGSALFAILLLAALRTVPAAILDAAVVDGATVVRRLQHVILPELRPALMLGFVLSFLGTFGDFAIVQLVTRGGPLGATQTLPTLALQTGIYETDIGLAAAIALSFLPLYAVGLVLLVRQVRP